MQLNKIFLADDDQDDWFIIEDSMKEIGLPDAITFYSDGSDLLDALEQIPESANLPRLIILDLNMPRTNGTETLQSIKSSDRFTNIPVIIYSTSVNAVEKQKCIDLGAFDYITKPISSRESLVVAQLFSSFLK